MVERASSQRIHIAPDRDLIVTSSKPISSELLAKIKSVVKAEMQNMKINSLWEADYRGDLIPMSDEAKQITKLDSLKLELGTEIKVKKVSRFRQLVRKIINLLRKSKTSPEETVKPEEIHPKLNPQETVEPKEIHSKLTPEETAKLEQIRTKIKSHITSATTPSVRRDALVDDPKRTIEGLLNKFCQSTSSCEEACISMRSLINQPPRVVSSISSVGYSREEIVSLMMQAIEAKIDDATTSKAQRERLKFAYNELTRRDEIKVDRQYQEPYQNVKIDSDLTSVIRNAIFSKDEIVALKKVEELNIAAQEEIEKLNDVNKQLTKLVNQRSSREKREIEYRYEKLLKDSNKDIIDNISKPIADTNLGQWTTEERISVMMQVVQAKIDDPKIEANDRVNCKKLYNELSVLPELKLPQELKRPYIIE